MRVKIVVLMIYGRKSVTKKFLTFKIFIFKNNSIFRANTCLTFNKTILLPNTTEFLFVKCKAKSSKSKKPVYVDAHATIRRKENVTERLEQFKDQDTRKPISVLMMGIDSVSRLNLIRAMPRTAQTFYDNGWFELRGYNKVFQNKIIYL